MGEDVKFTAERVIQTDIMHVRRSHLKTILMNCYMKQGVLYEDAEKSADEECNTLKDTAREHLKMQIEGVH